MKKEEMICKKCLYFEPTMEKIDGYCHKHITIDVEKLDKIVTATNHYVVAPRTWDDSWCGDGLWVEKQPPDHQGYVWYNWLHWGEWEPEGEAEGNDTPTNEFILKRDSTGLDIIWGGWDE